MRPAETRKHHLEHIRLELTEVSDCVEKLRSRMAKVRSLMERRKHCMELRRGITEDGIDAMEDNDGLSASVESIIAFTRTTDPILRKIQRQFQELQTLITKLEQKQEDASSRVRNQSISSHLAAHCSVIAAYII